MIQTVSALLVVVGTLALLRVVLSLSGRGGAGGGGERLRVTKTCVLSGRQRLHVVEVEGERLLLGATDGSIRVLRKLPPVAESVADGGGAPDAIGRTRAVARRGLRLLRAASPLVALATLAVAKQALGAPPETGDGLDVVAGALAGATEPERVASTLQVVALLTVVSVAPSILLMATCFTRVLIVLAFLRQAIGVQQLPPGQVLAGLALFVTVFVMAPVAERVRVEAIDPYVQGEIDERDAAQRLVVPVRDFLVHSTRESDLALFASIAETEVPEDLAEVPITTLLPAYMLSELRTAFEIGFMIYLPFLVIDLIIASMLISMGMIVLPPIVIALPFKLMLFVLLDGWNLIIGSLVSGLR